jgi:hypothetical protein
MLKRCAFRLPELTGPAEPAFNPDIEGFKLAGASLGI